MRKIGIIASILGALILIYALSMDTTVTYISGMERFGKEGFNLGLKSVHNIGLIEEKHTLQMIGGLAILVGVLLIGFSIKEVTGKNTSVKEHSDSVDKNGNPGVDRGDYGVNDNKFEGEMDISLPSYQLFLTKIYEIEKNNTLDKYVLGDQVFDSLENVLLEANLKYKAELEKENQRLIKIEEEKLAQEKLAIELAEKARQEEELRLLKKQEEDERLAPIRAANKKKISIVIAISLVMLSGFFVYYGNKQAKEREARELAEKIERERIEEEMRLAEEQRKRTEEKIKEELKVIFSTGSIFGFKIGDDNLERLSKVSDNKSEKKEFGDEYYIKCGSDECKDLFKDAAITEALKSVKFSFCVPDAKETKGQKYFKMTGFKIVFKEYQQAKEYREYLALNKNLPNPPSKVIQKFDAYSDLIALNWKKDTETRDYNYRIRDICNNWRGIFGGRPHKY